MSGRPVWLSTTLLGLGTVFAGLIGLILVSKVMSFFCMKAANKKAAVPVPAAAPAPAPAAVAPAPADGISDRPAFVAAVSAAIATVMGANVSALRIVSIKKVD